MRFYNADFSYNYSPETRLLQVTYKWKITGDLKRIINKTYTAQYNLNAKRL